MHEHRRSTRSVALQGERVGEGGAREGHSGGTNHVQLCPMPQYSVAAEGGVAGYGAEGWAAWRVLFGSSTRAPQGLRPNSGMIIMIIGCWLACHCMGRGSWVPVEGGRDELLGIDCSQ